MHFQVLSDGTLQEVLAGHDMVIEGSDIHFGTILNYFKGLILTTFNDVNPILLVKQFYSK